MSTRKIKLMMLLVTFLFISAYAAPTQNFDHTHAAYNAILKRVVAHGRVDYQVLKADPKALNLYLDTLAAVSEGRFKSWTKSQRLAFLINLYNATTLRLIIDHYPVKSIKDIGSFFRGPWKQKVVRLFGQTITLNTLEHEIIRKQFDEPRVHAALVCAAKGCPPLRSEAYVADRLDEQLTDQMQQFLANRIKNRVDAARGKVYLSPIFKWYGTDFKKNGTSLLNALLPYWPQPEADLLKSRRDWDIDYTDYDWSLNEQVPK